MNKQDILALLKQDVVPALGCTEPVCVALATAKAGQLLEDEVTSITVYANTGGTEFFGKSLGKADNRRF